MYNLPAFRAEVKKLLSKARLPDGERATQNRLAEAVYLSVAELSKRLNGAAGVRLTHDNVKAIVLALAGWEVFSREAQIVELMSLVECPPFEEAQWNRAPLKDLKRMKGERPAPGKSNLPLELSDFVGRSEALATCCQLLTQHRLLTITGAGGMGKTRLAIEVAHNLRDVYTDGAYMVRLDTVASGELVAQAVAATFALREEHGRDLSDTISEFLADKQLLLVLDNCEHLLADVAELAYSLYCRCDSLTILATSRQPLLIRGETSWPLPALELPSATQQQSITALRQSEAVNLFCIRVNETLPSWSLNVDNAKWVVEICQRLDGVPLAIELAAAQVRRMIGVEDIARELADYFNLKDIGSRNLPRHETMRASIEWSWGLLTRDERRTLEYMAVFAPGWDLAATKAVCAVGDVEGGEVISIVGQLGQKSLLVAETEAATVRYRLLEPIRQYALERLTASNAAAATYLRHLDHYLRLAEQAEPGLNGPEQASWLARLEREHSNLRAGFDYACKVAEGARALRLAVSLARFWQVRGYLREGCERLARALEVNGNQSGNEVDQVAALNWLGNFTRAQGEFNSAAQYHERALTLAQAVGDQQGIARAWNNLGMIAHTQSDFEQAQRHFSAAEAIGRELNDDLILASALHGLGFTALYLRDYAVAQTHYQNALARLHNLGDMERIADTLSSIGYLGLLQGDYAAAQTYGRESMAIYEKLGDKGGAASAHINVGRAAVMKGDYVTAEQQFETGLQLAHEAEAKWVTAWGFANLGLLDYLQGRYASALPRYRESLRIEQEQGDEWACAEQLIGIAGALAGGSQGAALRAVTLLAAGRSYLDTRAVSLDPPEQLGYERTTALLHERVSDTAFASAWAAGAVMSIATAVEELAATAS